MKKYLFLLLLCLGCGKNNNHEVITHKPVTQYCYSVFLIKRPVYNEKISTAEWKKDIIVSDISTEHSYNTDTPYILLDKQEKEIRSYKFSAYDWNFKTDAEAKLKEHQNPLMLNMKSEILGKVVYNYDSYKEASIERAKTLKGGVERITQPIN